MVFNLKKLWFELEEVEGFIVEVKVWLFVEFYKV